MGSTLKRRISRLEQATGSGDDEMIELEFSVEGKALLRDGLTGLMTPEEIEATVNGRQSIPRSLRRGLSPEGQAMLEETLESLRAGSSRFP